MEIEIEVAERLLSKVRAFVAGLDDEERQLFAALIGPGVSLAHGSSDPDRSDEPVGADEADEVVGFAAGWSRRQLPEHLAEAIRRHGVRVVGL